ncbi:hypothetical protein [Ferroacidibacillus organovorans]|uniref:Uncharacterized protein n=1 Tax=Ferroacidibacillus organovorans TaxID=1765683 RepID=A0A101XNF4_9BACL|nr:hypothetical protein [Ferroacidibacillus organovorans]KUO94652.1 hypothetical protein ATW55_01940 [Ferroacidibacillus organovorans]
MGMLIVLLFFFVTLALIIDTRQLVQERSFKVWFLYSLLLMIGISFVILSMTPIHQLNLFSPVERVMHPICQWVFQR